MTNSTTSRHAFEPGTASKKVDMAASKKPAQVGADGVDNKQDNKSRGNEPGVTGEVIKQRAQSLCDVLQKRAATTNAERCLPSETIADFRRAGLFRVLQPRAFGGFELEPQVLFDAQMIIAAACPSSAWVLGVVAVHAWQLALFPEQTQRRVWGDDGEALISSSYMPVGKVERVDGGYRLSGRWGFSSGSSHCDWVFLGAFVPPDANAKGPDMRTFLLPRKDYELVDTWHVSGLKGTGSYDVVVRDVFVPEEHTHKFSDGFLCNSPGNDVHAAPLYRIPFGQIFVRSVSTPAIGMAIGALAHYRELTKTRIGRADGAKAIDDPNAHLICAEASSTIDEAQLVLRRNFDELMAHARAGERVSIERRVQFRYESAKVVGKCVAAVDRMFTACGGRALQLDYPLQRFFQDIHACRAHYANNPYKPALNYGGVQLGQKTSDYFI